jgi:hypothetical protein
MVLLSPADDIIANGISDANLFSFSVMVSTCYLFPLTSIHFPFFLSLFTLTDFEYTEYTMWHWAQRHKDKNEKVEMAALVLLTEEVMPDSLEFGDGSADSVTEEPF